MDMKINKEILRRERELRAWTQSHLAEVADLSMRTVQRIERMGDGSLESASALASALNLDLQVLMTESKVNRVVETSGRHHRWGVLGVIVSVILALSWWSTAAAEQITVSLLIETPENIHSGMAVIHNIGQESEMQLDNKFRLVFNTEPHGEHLLFSTKIYNFVENEYRLISNPTLLVEIQKPAAIQINSPDGQQLRLQVLANF